MSVSFRVEKHLEFRRKAFYSDYDGSYQHSSFSSKTNLDVVCSGNYLHDVGGRGESGEKCD